MGTLLVVWIWELENATKRASPEPAKKKTQGLVLRGYGPESSFFQPRVRQKGSSGRTPNVMYRKSKTAANHATLSRTWICGSELRRCRICFCVRWRSEE